MNRRSVRARPIAKAKAKRRIQISTPTRNPATALRDRHVDSRAWIGIDLSLNALAMAGLGWDSVLKKYVGPCFVSVQWHKQDHYFTRLHDLSLVQNRISTLMYDMKMFINLENIYIAQEEPWPLGLASRSVGQSQTLKQQAEMSGALLAGLLRYGYRNIFQINAAWWKKIVADDLGITIHYSKWGKGLQGKMRPKEWALAGNHGWGSRKWHNEFPNKVPVWPDLIADSKNGGRKPKPENSRAKPLQPDDRYQALPMALWVMREERA
jgi:hypothetical protein